MKKRDDLLAKLAVNNQVNEDIMFQDLEKLFLHVCCGPCAAYPIEFLKTERPKLHLELWFYNPNIHPKSEFLRRRDSLAFLAQQYALNVDFDSPYNGNEFLAELAVSPQEPKRCRRCYALRFEAAASEAAARGFKAFASTLAFSRRQKHELIIEEGRQAAAKYGIEFFYEDWRSGWNRGHELARSFGLYRQNYCGCIYSELER